MTPSASWATMFILGCAVAAAQFSFTSPRTIFRPQPAASHCAPATWRGFCRGWDAQSQCQCQFHETAPFDLWLSYDATLCVRVLRFAVIEAVCFVANASTVHFDWKNHPVVVAALAAAGAFAFAITYIAPVYTTELQTDLRLLKKEVERLQSELNLQTDAAAAAKEKIKELTLANETAHKRLQKAELSGLYSSGSAYPVGLERIKIGDNINDIFKVYRPESIKKVDEESYEVSNEHTFFDKVTYYYDPKSPKSNIVQISLHASSVPFGGDDIVLEKLYGSIGRPTSNPEKGRYCWNLKQGVSAYIIFGGSYQLMDSQHYPRLWPQSGCVEKK